MVKKPVGDIGPIKVFTNNAVNTTLWNTIRFPDSKEGLETYFCNRFIAEYKKSGAIFNSVVRNSENDFDFTLSLPGGQVNLDLVEIVLSDNKSSPYNSDKVEIKYQDYVLSVIEQIKKKNDKYASKSVIPIHLLMYFTHWRFAPNDEVIALIKHDLKEEKLNLENIFLYCPIDSENGELRVLHPTTKDYFEGVEVDKFRTKVFINFNPAKYVA